MPGLARYLSDTAPGLCVQLVDLVPDDYAGTLEKHKVDVALIPGASFPDWTDSQPVFRSDFVTIARADNPRLARAGLTQGATIPLDLYCDLGHVVFSPEGKTRTLGDAALAPLGRSRRVVMTLPAFSGICTVVAQTDHIALVPHQLAEAVAARLGLVVYRQPMAVPRATISMVWHRRTTNSPVHRWLRAALCQTLGPLNPAD